MFLWWFGFMLLPAAINSHHHCPMSRHQSRLDTANGKPNPSFVFGNICTVRDTSVSQAELPTKQYCNQDLVFEDNFDKFDQTVWKHENTLRGGGNWEFQWYSPDPRNSFVKDGYLHIRPTLTSDDYSDKDFIQFGTISLGENCTDGRDFGCERMGSFTNVVNPIKSASLTTSKTFSFKYGKVEVRAKMPRGDWLWPNIVMLPKSSVYGEWPASGQFILVESRGNANLTQNGENIGIEQVRSAILAGPNAQTNIVTSTFNTQGKTFHREFHRYQMEWTPDYIRYKLDNKLIGEIEAKDGFYKVGDYESQGVSNPWTNGTLLAPFDQEFYLQIQLAVGGVSKYFPDVNDEIENPGGKPWTNDSPQAATDFWTYRNSWLEEWDLVEGSTKSSLMVDYIKIWSLR